MAPTITTAPTTSTTTTTTVLSPVTTQPAAEPTPSPFVSTWLPILAIAISLWSAYNSWRSRRTSERSAGLTEQRRPDRAAPAGGGGPNHRVRQRQRGPRGRHPGRQRDDGRLRVRALHHRAVAR
jgi:hypothetical protein